VLVSDKGEIENEQCDRDKYDLLLFDLSRRLGVESEIQRRHHRFTFEKTREIGSVHLAVLYTKTTMVAVVALTTTEILWTRVIEFLFGRPVLYV